MLSEKCLCYIMSGFTHTGKIILVCTGNLFAQQNDGVVDMKNHKIVMQFTDSDSLSQATVLGQVKNIRTAWPNAEIEVVCHGGGLDLLQTKKSKAAARTS